MFGLWQRLVQLARRRPFPIVNPIDSRGRHQIMADEVGAAFGGRSIGGRAAVGFVRKATTGELAEAATGDIDAEVEATVAVVPSRTGVKVAEGADRFLLGIARSFARGGFQNCRTLLELVLADRLDMGTVAEQPN